MNRREFLQASSGVVLGTTMLAEGMAYGQQRKKKGPSEQVSVSELPGKTWILAVGVSTYLYNIDALPSPAQDVENIKKSFEGTNTQVVALVNGATGEKSPRPTKHNIEQAFKDLLTKVGPNDSFWFYFSGHGWSLNGISYLLPEDTRPGPDMTPTLLSVSEIRKQMQAVRARNRVLVLDACQSGSAKALSGKPPTWEGILGSAKGVVTMAACEVDQSAIDTGRGSLFTNYLLRGVLGQGAENEKTITLQGLEHFVKDRVVAASAGRQTPVFLYAKQDPVSIARPNISALERLPDIDNQVQLVRRPLKPGLIVLIEEEHIDPAGNRERDTALQLSLQGSFVKDGFPVMIAEEARNFRVRLTDPDANVVKQVVAKMNSRFLLRGTVKVRPVPKRFDIQNDFETVQAQVNVELIDAEGGSLGSVVTVETGRGISDASAIKMAVDRATKRIHDELYAKLRSLLPVKL